MRHAKTVDGKIVKRKKKDKGKKPATSPNSGAAHDHVSAQEIYIGQLLIYFFRLNPESSQANDAITCSPRQARETRRV